MEMMKEAHMSLIEAGTRDSVTLLGSGGIVAADHPPKAIICGLDAVGLDNAALVALQGRPEGEMRDATNIEMVMPKNLDEDWGVQRLKNLFGSWRDQMLEILGAMGVREVRRLRGELGRSMMVDHLETEAFGDIEGFDGFIKTSPAIDGGDV
jgi:glutamate synthase domain-containing protein 2